MIQDQISVIGHGLDLLPLVRPVDDLSRGVNHGGVVRVFVHQGVAAGSKPAVHVFTDRDAEIYRLNAAAAVVLHDTLAVHDIDILVRVS